MHKWDAAQWGYIAVMMLGAYFLGLAFVWLKIKRYRADPFFYYVVLLVGGTVLSRIGTAIARHYMLIGNDLVRDEIISSCWWTARNFVPAIVLLLMNIHATYRFWIKNR